METTDVISVLGRGKTEDPPEEVGKIWRSVVGCLREKKK